MTTPDDRVPPRGSLDRLARDGDARPSRGRASGSVGYVASGYDEDTDRYWWAPLLWLPTYFGLIVAGAVALGVWGAAAAWLLFPAATAALVVAWSSWSDRREARARVRHPAGSARDGRSWLDAAGIAEPVWVEDEDAPGRLAYVVRDALLSRRRPSQEKLRAALAALAELVRQAVGENPGDSLGTGGDDEDPFRARSELRASSPDVLPTLSTGSDPLSPGDIPGSPQPEAEPTTALRREEPRSSSSEEDR